MFRGRVRKITLFLGVIIIVSLVAVGFVWFDPFHEGGEEEEFDTFDISDAELNALFNNTPNFFSDPVDDFVNPRGAYPPGGVYAFSPVDFINISVADDGLYLYVKYVMAVDFPEEPVNVQGNIVESISINGAIDIDQNSSTGSPGDVGAEAAIAFKIELEYGEMSAYYFANATGIQEPEEDRFTKHGDGWVVRGGSGSNYVAVVYSLEDLGIVNKNKVDIAFWAEAASEHYHHFSFDQAPNNHEKKYTCIMSF